ncbi:MAG: DUF6265 family protein [Bryobacteraceae bacterium]
MKPRIFLPLFACTVAAVFPEEIKSLGFLAGCWEGRFGPVVMEEQWMKPAGGTMLGIGRVVKGDRAVHTEFLRLVEKEGKIAYIAHPSQNAAPTVFPLTKLTETEVVFENPKHDFPQRISYTRQPNGDVLAQIDGVQNGKPRVEKFPYKRVKCAE